MGERVLVVVLAFCGAALSVVTQSETAPPNVRLVAGALAAGAIAALALLKNPGQSAAPDEQTARLRLRQRPSETAPESPTESGRG